MNYKIHRLTLTSAFVAASLLVISSAQAEMVNLVCYFVKDPDSGRHLVYWVDPDKNTITVANTFKDKNLVELETVRTAPVQITPEAYNARMPNGDVVTINRMTGVSIYSNGQFNQVWPCSKGNVPFPTPNF